jgi:hypothetical protein
MLPSYGKLISLNASKKAQLPAHMLTHAILQRYPLEINTRTQLHSAAINTAQYTLHKVTFYSAGSFYGLGYDGAVISIYHSILIKH